MDIEKIEIEDIDYPSKLKYIKDPPKRLYVLGNKELLKTKGVAIIGSRDCTKEGMRNARMFAANIAKAGLTVISGMAKGIDTAAHMGALDVNGRTIAVLGNGPGFVYPPENEKIYNEILLNGGVIVSEYPEYTPPESERFRQRNRIVSGLSLGVLIVEAEFRSGTTITARYAKEEGRDVFCIPNSRENKKGIGTNMLIQKGAKLVLEPNEIIEKYSETIEEQISIDELEKGDEIYVINLSKMKEEYIDIYKMLNQELSINEISVRSNMDVTSLYQKLFEMEMEGLIECNRNKYRIKKERL